MAAVEHRKALVVQSGRACLSSCADRLGFKAGNRDIILNVLKLVDVEKAKASYEEDRGRILSQCKTKYTFDGVNRIVNGSVTGAIAGIMAEYDLIEVPRATVTNNKERLRAAAEKWDCQHL